MTAITISCVCVGGVGLLIALISIPFFAKAINAKKNCVAHATGTVIKYKYGGGSNGRSVAPVVEFEVEGEKYRAYRHYRGVISKSVHNLNPNEMLGQTDNIMITDKDKFCANISGIYHNYERLGKVKWPLGSNLPVVYNPKKPKQAFVEKVVVLSDIVGIVLVSVGVGFMLLATLMFFLLDGGKDKPEKNYIYNHEEILSISIEKTLYYSDKLVIQFGEDSISKAEKVICYDDNFNVVDVVDFFIEENHLTISSDNALKISGLYIIINVDKEIKVRCLDSDNYAMIVYTWADDIGMMPEGDLDTYYTEEEKQKQEEIEDELEAMQAEAFSYIEGTWENDDKTLRMEIKEVEGNRVIEVYAEDGIDIGLPSEIPIDTIHINKETEPIEVIVYDNVNWGAAYWFYLYNDNTELQYFGTDIILKRVE